jgi:DNA-binding MarR family transcriptional regulator
MTSVNEDSQSGTAHIGRLLWAAFQRARVDGMALMATDPAAAGALTASHARLLDQVPPDGARVTDLAACMRITKQALGQLVAQLADRGYVEIDADPNDRRAKVVRCTPRGESARSTVQAVAAALEDRWRAEVGDSRYTVFREVLAEIGAR